MLNAEGIASYQFALAGTSSPGFNDADAQRALSSELAALHIGGLGLVLDPQASAIAHMVESVGPRTLVALDPNCRADAVADPAAYRRRLRQILARTDVVKASEEDLAYLQPGHGPAQIARGLLACGPSLVLVTLGSLGALVLSQEREALIEAPKAQVVDTIGAGDAFGAAWLGAWICWGLGAPGPEDFDAAVRAARCAAAVAARTCERAGAEPPEAAEMGADWLQAMPTLPTTMAGR